jgi:hypothetical protein
MTRVGLNDRDKHSSLLHCDYIHGRKKICNTVYNHKTSHEHLMIIGCVVVPYHKHYHDILSTPYVVKTPLLV